MSIEVVELFAGVGGFRVGLERASDRFQTIWANQWEPGRKSQWAYDCYVGHFGECVNVDINIAKSDCPKHDLLCGGFPCQDYSVANTLNTAKGIEGKKGVLWWDIRDIVEKCNPRYILLENVDRLLKSPAKQRGRDFGIILKCLNDLGYCVEWRVINASDYGCAQRRRRTFIFAYDNRTDLFIQAQNNLNADFIVNRGFFSDVFHSVQNNEKKPVEFELNAYNSLSDVTERFKADFRNGGLCVDGKGISVDVIPVYIPSTPLKNIVETGDVDGKYFLNEAQLKKFEYLRGSKKLERTDKNGFKYTYSEGAMSPFDDLDLPARTMLTSESSINRSTHIIKDPKTGKLRLLTPLECERINGFPDNWTKDVMPDSFRYFCMGNALVVPLITMMGHKILALDEARL